VAADLLLAVDAEGFLEAEAVAVLVAEAGASVEIGVTDKCLMRFATIAERAVRFLLDQLKENRSIVLIVLRKWVDVIEINQATDQDLKTDLLVPNHLKVDRILEQSMLSLTKS